MKPNILFITADDMNWDAVGAFGCPTPGTTPNIDRLASQGVCFHHAHVNISVCQPSRSVMMTGRYSHNNGGEGFFHLRHPSIPILPEVMREANYNVGILGKLGHSTPYGEFEWDMTYDMEDMGYGRNPEVYRQRTREFISGSIESGRPFFLMANSHDPHRPFYGNDNPEWYEEGEYPKASIPSKVFKPEEVVTPGFLPDLPNVRLEISEYYSSVRRCDDTVGTILEELDKAGCADNTIVIFLSDNGMAFPFSKTNCYLNSTRTPWIMRWPEKIAPGAYEQNHFIAGVDLMPTLLDAAGIDLPDMDGNSFLPLLLGDEQGNREYVYTQFHQTAGKRNYPMRCIQNKQFGYIFNPWSDGLKEFKNESQSGRTMNAMTEAAEDSEDIAARVQLFLYRVPEEFYDFRNDPDALVNLIDYPDYQDEINKLREELENWMLKTGDPALEAFRLRNSREKLDCFLKQMSSDIGGD